MTEHSRDSRDADGDVVRAVVTLCNSMLEGAPFTSQFEGRAEPWRREDEETFRFRVDDLTDDTGRFYALVEGWKSTKEYVAALAAISGDTVLTRHVGHLIGDPYSQRRLSADDVLLRLLIRAADTAIDQAEAVTRSLDQLRGVLSATAQARRVIGPLPSGFKTSVNAPVVLDDTTIIGPLDDRDIATILHLGRSFSDMPDAYGLAYVGTPWAIQVSYEVPFVSRPPDEPVADEVAVAASEARHNAHARLRSLIHALRLIHAGRISILGELDMSDDAVGGRHTSFATRYQRPPRDAYEFSDADIDQLRSTINDLEHPAVTSSPALATAVRRFSSSAERHDEEDRLVDLIICAEALFAGDSVAGDLSLRVAQRFARFAANPEDDILNLFELMKSQYDGRSKIVHAAKRTERVQKRIDTALRQVNELEPFMRRAVRRALDETTRRGRFDIDWNRLVLTGHLRD